MDIDTGSHVEALRRTLETQLRHHTGELATLAAADPDTTGEDRQSVAVRTAAARHLIGEITAALARMTAGGYGRCEHCAGPIPGPRLEILPHARFCVPCQARR